jgi:serine/threonine protein kinase
MRKTGGEFLGQGVAACVVSPPIKCINQNLTQSKGVGKLFYDKGAYETEVREAEKIKNMDPTGQYTNPIKNSCEFLRLDIPTEDLKKCTVHDIVFNEESALINKNKAIRKKTIAELKEGAFNIFRFIEDKNIEDLKQFQIVYEHEGVDFEKYLETTEDSFEEVFGHLLQFAKGIAFFNGKHNYSHMDIKAPNLLITKEGKDLLIDFGLSKDTNEIYKDDFVLNFPYVYYPPEFRMFVHHKDIILNEENTYDKNVLKEKVIGIYKALPKIGNEFYKRMEKKYEATFSQINNKFAKIKDEKKLRNEYSKAFSKKVDVFSFGVVILETLHILQTKFENNEKFTKIHKIGEAATDIDPDIRMNIEDVVEELEKIIDPKKTLGGRSSLKDLKQYLKGPTFTKIKLCNLVDKYKMQPKFKKLNKELLSNAIAEHMILHKKNVPKTPVKAPKTPVKTTPKTPVKTTPKKKT